MSNIKFKKTVVCIFPIYYNRDRNLHDLEKDTYRVKVVCLKDMDADSVLKNLSQKKNSEIEKRDLVPLLLTPLMSGKMPEKERILQGFQWLSRKYPEVDEEDLNKMQAVLYALAVKTLKSKDLKEIKEAISMTILGQMLVEDGIKKGIKKGREEGRQEASNVWKLSVQGESPEAISQTLKIPLKDVVKILED